MKKYIFLLTIVVIFTLFALPVSAEEQIDGYLSDFESILPEDMSGITEDGEAIIEKFSIKGLLSEILASVTGEGSEIIVFFLTLIGGVAISLLASNCHENFSKQTQAAVGLVISLTVFPSVSSALSAVEHSLSELGSFFTALTPIAVGITALGGGAATAGVQASGMYTAFTVIGGVGSGLFLSLSAFGLAIALLSALGNPSALMVGKGIKSFFNWAVGIFTTTITAVFSLQTLITSAADSATMRTARYMASGLIPVVGSTVSGALATLAAGLSYAKSIVGGGSVAVIISLALSPLIMLLLYRLALTVASNVAGLVGAEGASGIFTAYRFSLDMTVAVYVLSVIVYLFQVILFLRIGVAIE